MLTAGTAAGVQQVQALAGNRAVASLFAATAPRARRVETRCSWTEIAGVQRQSDESGGASGSSTSDAEGWAATSTQALVYQRTGAVVRDVPQPPEAGSSVVAELAQNTRVLSLRHNSATRWHEVRVVDGAHAGTAGYLADWLVRDDAPDMGAEIYDVQGGDHLGAIVQNHPQYTGYPIVTGDDARSLVMAVYTANARGPGVRLVGDADGGMDEAALDALDDYREITRRIYQTIELVAGKQIWLPSVAYVEALKASGTIPHRAGWKNAAIETGKRATGLNVGLVEGMVGSVIDLIVGLFDLAKGVIDAIIATITGEALSSLGELLTFLEALVEEDRVLQFASDVAAGLVHSTIDAGESFLSQWQEPPVFDAWRFRGKVVGYVIAEVLLAFLSGGASALKWLDKLGDVGRIARRIISRVDDAVDDLPVPGRRRPGEGAPGGGRRADGDDDPSPERLAVVLKARAVAESHDALDSPVDVAVAMLNQAFKPGNPWINDFYSEPRPEPGHHRVLMRIPIDDDYSTERRDVWDHENNGGHAIERHVGKDINWLRRRLLRQPEIEAASTFTSVRLANMAQGTFVKRFEKEIGEWLRDDRDDAPARFTATVDLGYVVGEVLERGANKTERTTRAFMVIVRDDTAHGWHFVTAFPEL